MKTVVLTRHGKPEAAFELREAEKPRPRPGQVLIRVEAFGLNFADVMARQGLYADAPPLPSVLGYDVVGRIDETGPGVTNLTAGQRVLALTRFGGYAEFVTTDARAVIPVSESLHTGVATALATQYSTAYYCAEETVTLHEGDKVLIHAAAGGVGTALVQMAKRKGCVIYGTASGSKLKYLEEQGVHFPVDYTSQDFSAVIGRMTGPDKLDVIFDSIGGMSVQKGFRLLNYGGRMVCFGASDFVSAKGNPLKLLRFGIGFGLYSPISLLKRSTSLICVNMLHIADHRPDLLQRCLQGVHELYKNGQINPVVGGEFKVADIAQAHTLLESRRSTGKIVVRW